MYMDEGSQVDVIYFDFKKAFDRVDNDILLGKLYSIGFTPNLLEFFADYLRDRKQFVRHGCYESCVYRTCSGVSQGSVLGPLLFLLMINDLPQVLKHATCLLFADDLKIILDINEVSDHVRLQSDIDAVQNWSHSNKLLFNSAKCCVMSFTRSKNPSLFQYTLDSNNISRVFTVKDLGVHFDPKLNFHEHIQKLTASSFKQLGFVIRNCRDFDNVHAIKLLYSAFVRSKLEASSKIWNPYETSYTLQVEKVQKAFLRFLYKKLYSYYPFLYPTQFLLGALGYNSLRARRNWQLMQFVSRGLRGESDCLELVSRLCKLFVPDNYLRSRRHKLLAVPMTRTVARKQSPLLRGLAELNAFLASVRGSECDVFVDRFARLTNEYLLFSERDG